MIDTLTYFKRRGHSIAALATAVGGPVSIVRVSGSALTKVESLVGPLPKPGTFELRNLKTQDGTVLDRALVLYFQNPNSFTGEDVIEIQGHGVASVSETILLELTKLGVERALPGEFSFRAYLSGKMDLKEAEALQMAYALEGLSQETASKLVTLKTKSDSAVTSRLTDAVNSVLSARGRAEAAIDFPEAEEEQSNDIRSAEKFLVDAQSSLASLLNSHRNFCQAGGEITVAIVGEPNAGKSSLFNLLVGGYRAIVSPHAGTTRDVVDARIRLPSGRTLRVIDTAGLRNATQDSVESLGIELGVEAALSAQLVIWVRHIDRARTGTEEASLESRIALLSQPRVEIKTHADLYPAQRNTNAFSLTQNTAEVSRWILGELDQLAQGFDSTRSQATESEFVSLRQGELIALSLVEVQSALECVRGQRPLELAADHLRKAEEKLRQSVGQELSDEYIGQIFSHFCLGK